jgi:GT2 family glycosyltransferase
MVREVRKVMDVSVIILNFNSFDLSYQTISTFIKFAKGFTYEIIVLDNNSHDNSFTKLQQQFPDLVYIKNNENLGFGKANNIGLNRAQGDFVVFLNNDIIFIENSILTLLKFLREKDEKILIAPQLLNADKSVQSSVYCFQTLWLTFTTSFFLYALFPKSRFFNKYYFMNKKDFRISEVDTITGAFMMAKKDYLVEINGFDEDFFFYGEDNDLCKRFRDFGGKVIYFPETKLIHLKGGANSTNWFTEKNHAMAYLRLFKKHYSLPKRVFAYLFYYSGITLRILFLSFHYLVTFKDITKVNIKNKFKTLFIFPNQV